MKELYKPTLVSLSERQDRNMEESIKNFLYSCVSLEGVKACKAHLRRFVDDLESFCFISPNERRYYMGFIENTAEEHEEILKKEKKE